jgi:hypothetical protein
MGRKFLFGPEGAKPEYARHEARLAAMGGTPPPRISMLSGAGPPSWPCTPADPSDPK